MWKLEDLIASTQAVSAEVEPGKWVPARPLVGPFSWRLRDAWEVLRGRADAVKWPDQ